MSPEYMKFLVGKKIVLSGISQDGTPYFILNDKTVVYVLQDEEGNGPGHLEIQSPQ